MQFVIALTINLPFTNVKHNVKYQNKKMAQSCIVNSFHNEAILISNFQNNKAVLLHFASMATMLF